MDVRVGDILLMKKKHPCGGEEFTVTRSGMDFKLVCRTCGREIMIPRAKAGGAVAVPYATKFA